MVCNDRGDAPYRVEMVFCLPCDAAEWRLLCEHLADALDFILLQVLVEEGSALRAGECPQAGRTAVSLCSVRLSAKANDVSEPPLAVVPARGIGAYDI